jgi:phosphatidylserine/phosphatidylglycerophosphate/cardiolipin synthase-like enzyme
MDDMDTIIIDEAIRLAAVLPSGTIQMLAQTIIGGAATESELQLRATLAVPQPHLRALVSDLLTTWQEQVASATPAEVALTLRTAAAAIQSVRGAQNIDLVWSGPSVNGLALRRTDQALLQVINSATQSLLIVGFAIYTIPAITAALVHAAGRGVTIRICVDALTPSEQQMDNDAIQALGPEVARQTALYIWPSDQRPTDSHGNIGLLHAKCAIADGQLLFISNANVTEHGMNLNMELGALIKSELHASSVAAHFEQLIAHGVLQSFTLQ